MLLNDCHASLKKIGWLDHHAKECLTTELPGHRKEDTSIIQQDVKNLSCARDIQAKCQ